MVPLFFFVYGSYRVMCRNIEMGCGAWVYAVVRVLGCRDGLTAVKIKFFFHAGSPNQIRVCTNFHYEM
jgi:hypothetical protein